MNGLEAVYQFLADDPCDWQRWAVYADAVQEVRGLDVAGPIRGVSQLLADPGLKPRYVATRLLWLCPNAVTDFFMSGKLDKLPEPLWYELQLDVATSNPSEFWNRRMIGGLSFRSETLDQFRSIQREIVFNVGRVKRAPGSVVKCSQLLQQHTGAWSRWLNVTAIRRTDGLIFVQGNDAGIPEPDTLEWADAYGRGAA